MSNKLYRTAIFVCCLGLLVLAIINTAFHAAAQSDEGVWEEPINVSQSGTATNPILMDGANGAFHVLWQDAFAGYMYIQGDGRSWSDPIALRLPFSEPPFFSPESDLFSGLYLPTLVTDDNNVVHAFWTNGLGSLQYSLASIEAMTTAEGWSAPVQLSTSALGQDVTVDSNGRLHLVYMRPRSSEEFPAGIYYRRLDDSSVGWTTPSLLYQSDYMRAVDEEDANLSITTGEGGRVHVVWDNTPVESVFVTSSVDGGATWTTPSVIDQREELDAPEAPGPSKINVIDVDGTAHVTWQASHGTVCAQYHSLSDDGGQTWSPRQAILEGTLDCPVGNQFFVDENGLLFLLTTVGEDADRQLQAWNGDQWSAAEFQNPLSNFVAPDTFREMTLGCLQTAVTADNNLLVVGCGQSSVQDIWVIERPLGNLTTWFPPVATPVWSEPNHIASITTISSPQLVADLEGQFHAFWIGKSSLISASTNSAIFYAFWDGSEWSRPAPIFEVNTDQMTATLDNEGRLMLVWRDVRTDTLFYSQAGIDRAMFPLDWSVPVQLPASGVVVGWPNILVDDSGTISVAYNVPLNESRGIYFTQSFDRGKEWTDPITVFDGAAAGWLMVDQPQLVRTNNGDLHIIWKHSPVAPGEGSLALYYTRSEDDGQTWSAPKLLIEESIAGSGIASVGDEAVFVVWQEIENGDLSLWYTFSPDSGVSWEQPSLIPTLGNLTGPMSLVADPKDQLHLSQLTTNDEDEPVLRKALWDGNGWTVEEGLNLSIGTLSAATDLTSITNINGLLVVIYSGETVDEERQLPQNSLFAVSSSLTLPSEALPPPSTSVPTATPQISPTATPEPSPTPIPTISSNVAESRGVRIGPVDTGTQLGGILVGIVPALLLVGIVFGLVLFTIRTRGR